MTKREWLAIVAMGTIAVGVWYLYFTRPLPMGQEGSELMVIKRPFNDIILYPGVRLGDKFDDVREKVKRFGLPIWEIPPGLKYKINGRLPGMHEDIPMQVYVTAEQGRITMLGVETGDPIVDDGHQVEKFSAEWNSALERFLGPSKPYENEASYHYRTVYWRDPFDKSKILKSHLSTYPLYERKGKENVKLDNMGSWAYLVLVIEPERN
ncbi:MAG: hypothetical protein ACREJQ_05825 [bacterium]